MDCLFQPSTEQNLHIDELYHVISIVYTFTLFSHILQHSVFKFSCLPTLGEFLFPKQSYGKTKTTT